jgi:hypothetical protein
MSKQAVSLTEKVTPRPLLRKWEKLKVVLRRHGGPDMNIGAFELLCALILIAVELFNRVLVSVFDLISMVAKLLLRCLAVCCRLRHSCDRHESLRADTQHRHRDEDLLEGLEEGFASDFASKATFGRADVGVQVYMASARSVGVQAFLPDNDEVSMPRPSEELEERVHEGEALNTMPSNQELSTADEAERLDAGDVFCSTWVELDNAISDLDTYVTTFCNGFCVNMARNLSAIGTEMLACRILSAESESGHAMLNSTLLEVVASDPCKFASAVVWALMHRAVATGQGFKEGTFVVSGHCVDDIFLLLLPHTYDRRSSHFSSIAICVSEDDARRLPEGPSRTEVESRAQASSCHVGIDVRANGSHDLPAGKQHVLMGRIKNHDGSVSLYVKPEDHGCRISSETVAEAAWHGLQYMDSQWQRAFGDRRQHDEGVLKRKEHMPGHHRHEFDEIVKDLHSSIALSETTKASIGAYGLGEMARYLRRAEIALVDWLERESVLLTQWEAAYGDTLDLRHGREVIIHTSQLVRPAAWNGELHHLWREQSQDEVSPSTGNEDRLILRAIDGVP